MANGGGKDPERRQNLWRDDIAGGGAATGMQNPWKDDLPVGNRAGNALSRVRDDEGGSVPADGKAGDGMADESGCLSAGGMAAFLSGGAICVWKNRKRSESRDCHGAAFHGILLYSADVALFSGERTLCLPSG